MPSNDSRPVNLDLTKFSFPVPAIASISHRIGAVVSWVGMGFVIFVLNRTHGSPEGQLWFEQLLANNFLAQFVAWGLLSWFGYYCLATLKHIVQDLGYLEDLQGGRRISWAVLLGGAALAVVAGAYVWA
ncbi:MAG: succinate dehydrogenase, cytochrome b556 subunit [Pseudomonadales bacterium]|nr:MAG: succinate dehydrogenase, cytochrome b556 subunit [Pseudomonadales bacterium]